MEIYCELCGQKAHQRFSHLREVHEMKPTALEEKALQIAPGQGA